MNIKTLPIVFLGLRVLGGCGYSTRSLLPGNFRTIHIDAFKNNTTYTTERERNLYIPLLEVKVRNAIVSRFQFDGNLKINESDSADLVLKGELKGFQREVLRYTDNNDVQEYRIRITTALVLWDNVKQEKVWEEPNFIGETTYFPVGTQAKTESAAIEDALTDLAQRVVERTIEDW